MRLPERRQVSTVFCAPLPLAGRGRGWGSTPAVPMLLSPSLSLPRKGGGNGDTTPVRSPSRRFCSLAKRSECLAFRSQALEQRRRLERRIVGFSRVVRQPVGDVLQADLVGVVHRTAAIDRPAVAVYPDHVYVAGTRVYFFFEDARAFVDHRIHHALEDFLVADHAALAAEPLQRLVDQLFD